MLMLTGVLSWALLGATAAAAAAHDGALPVYFPNVDVQPAGLALFDAGEASALLSHFRGDGSVAHSEDADRAVRIVPSTFMDDRNTAVIIVDGFDTEAAEPHLGSPHFYLSNDATADITAGAARSHVSEMGRIDSLEHPVLRVSGLDGIAAELRKVANSKIMIIGLPNVAPRSGSRASLVEQARNMSYIQIPDFFDSIEDCQAVTSSCSGHGSCAKSSNGKYACQCKPTKKDDYTYYWGGNDCSKRDVSFQANLIIGTTIAILVASVLSVGLLFRLGSEPLPGILTATGTSS